MLRAMIGGWLVVLCVSNLLGQDYKAAPLEGPPAAEGIGSDLLAAFEAQGVKIMRGSRTSCEIWLRKDIESLADFKPSDERIYPFQQGQLIGLIHYPRKNNEFRDQEVQSGWYTLRFELQPVDGNHVGTSPTRDFLLMAKAENDQPGRKWETKELLAASAEVSGGSHPAMISLQRAEKSGESKPSLRHDEEKDWWVLRLIAKAQAGGKPIDVPLEMVVVGHAAE